MNKPKYTPPTISLYQLYQETPIMDGATSMEGEAPNPSEGGMGQDPYGESQSRGEGFNDNSFTPQTWE